MGYETIIGLEIHVELNTKTKAYCACKNEFGAEVNTNCCPVCIGLPGALPVLNRAVVEKAVFAGVTFGSKINHLSKQDRKNYYYPDTAKGYQISQYDIPLCEGGKVEFICDDKGNTKTINLERIQIEEDAGKMLHGESFDGTLIDFNRSGVPLIEIVTKPDLRSPQDAKAFLESLRAILVEIGVTDGKMQEGSIRCDVNVSVRKEGATEFGTRVEMKNVNTFSGAARAIEYEAQRQIDILENSGTIQQETRRWDDMAGVNETLRTKEDAEDYRYFPEPDLGNIEVTEETINHYKSIIPELPHERVLRFVKEYRIPLYDATLLIDSEDKSSFFLKCMEIGGVESTAVSNWILGDISRILKEKNIELADTKITPEKLVSMIELIENKTISNAAGKTVVEVVMFEDKNPEEVVKEKGLAQISDQSQLKEIAQQVINDNPQTIEQYKNGKTNVLGFLVGQCMKASKGQGNPAALKEIILDIIENS